MNFRPSPDENELSIDQIGDGLRSLFYVSLVCSLLRIENSNKNDILQMIKICELLCRKDEFTCSNYRKESKRKDHLKKHLKIKKRVCIKKQNGNLNFNYIL